MACSTTACACVSSAIELDPPNLDGSTIQSSLDHLQPWDLVWGAMGYDGIAVCRPADLESLLMGPTSKQLAVDVLALIQGRLLSFANAPFT